jgi:hypothetical protein
MKSVICFESAVAIFRAGQFRVIPVTIAATINGLDAFAQRRIETQLRHTLFCTTNAVPSEQKRWGRILTMLESGDKAHLDQCLIECGKALIQEPETKDIVAIDFARNKSSDTKLKQFAASEGTGLDLITVLHVDATYSLVDATYVYTDRRDLWGKTIVLTKDPVQGFTGVRTQTMIVRSLHALTGVYDNVYIHDGVLVQE